MGSLGRLPPRTDAPGTRTHCAERSGVTRGAVPIAPAARRRHRTSTASRPSRLSAAAAGRMTRNTGRVASPLQELVGGRYRRPGPAGSPRPSIVGTASSIIRCLVWLADGPGHPGRGRPPVRGAGAGHSCLHHDHEDRSEAVPVGEVGRCHSDRRRALPSSSVRRRTRRHTSVGNVRSRTPVDVLRRIEAASELSNSPTALWRRDRAGSHTQRPTVGPAIGST